MVRLKKQCEICDKKFPSGHYKRHIEQAHKDNRTLPAKDRECEICGEFFTVRKYQEHMSKIHSTKVQRNPCEES